MEFESMNSTERRVFSFFEKVCAIPRGSFHEEKIAAFLCEFAQKHGLFYRTDKLHNVLIKKPASPGYENEPTVMLQGHTDMVCEKTSQSTHDFEKEGIVPILQDGFVHADETTLGADNGIAVAMMLSILEDDSLCHGPLECLFTVQEEVGLTGAAEFDYSDCRASLLYNLDSEDEGVATISCAGGVRCDMVLPIQRESAKGWCFFELSADGFAGGHSGTDIDLGRVNAIRTLGCLLSHARRSTELRLASIDGGAMDNAIPRACRAVVAVKPAEKERFTEIFRTQCDARRSSFSAADADAEFRLREIEPCADAMCRKSSDALLAAITSVPNGVLRRTHGTEKSQLETSANLGIVRTERDTALLTVSVRSSVDARRGDVTAVLQMLATALGASLTLRGEYPGWPSREHSKSRERYTAAYRALWGKEPRIEAIHAGLECGVIQHKMPGIDPISIGPDMQHVHTPAERVNVASVGRVYDTLIKMLAIKDETK